MSETETTTAKPRGIPEDLSGLIVRPSEIVMVHLNPKPGVEGNEVHFRSGSIIKLPYETARRLAMNLNEAGEISRHSAKHLIFVKAK